MENNVGIRFFLNSSIVQPILGIRVPFTKLRYHDGDRLILLLEKNYRVVN
ncbi:MAG: hypothetical protein ACFCU7_04325 [Pleurocapsa sp.]